MSLFVTTIKDGAIKGVKTAFMLLKIVLPIYAIVVLFKYSPAMPFLQDIFAPAMRFFQLPGNAIVPLIAGFFTDEYGVIAAMRSFDYTTAQITTIAMITLVAHSMPVESAIAQKIGMSAPKLAAFRILSAVLVGLLVGWIGGLLG